MKSAVLELYIKLMFEIAFIQVMVKTKLGGILSYSTFERWCTMSTCNSIFILTFLCFFCPSRVTKKQAWAFPSAHSWTGPPHSSPNCRSPSSLTLWDHFAPPTTLLLLCQDTGSTNLMRRWEKKHKIQKRRTQQTRMRQLALTPPVCQHLNI